MQPLRKSFAMQNGRAVAHASTKHEQDMRKIQGCYTWVPRCCGGAAALLPLPLLLLLLLKAIAKQ